MKAGFRQPALYIPHGGGPCFFMDWDPPNTWHKMAAWLEQLGGSTGTPPQAIIVVSAHWEEKEFTVQTHLHPPLLYDYYGFPEHTYQLSYPAPGSPELAGRIQACLKRAGIPSHTDSQRGFDHGVFIPLKLVYPEANIPVVQLSLKAGLDPARHIAAGQAINELRDEGVLIIGSGMSYHNMQAFGDPANIVSDQFDAWLTEAVCADDAEVRNRKLCDWSVAPAGRRAHPREEHLLPLMVVAGAAGKDTGRKIFSDRVMGATVSAFGF